VLEFNANVFGGKPNNELVEQTCVLHLAITILRYLLSDLGQGLAT
jgi:hypothetical protein